ncbi:MAG: formyltransferase [Gammaproteobacteria bacterium]
MTRAVVFAYQEVGVRGLAVLLDQGVEIPLVVTHPDEPHENRWFGSVCEFAEQAGLPVIRPERDALQALLPDLIRLEPDFIFSFYYRHLIPVSLLQVARCGALNLHGSLLPRYRGRAPVNWALLKGERETGASLHYMVERADAGDLVDQLAVPILMMDQAIEVARKVAWAAEMVLYRSLPGLVAGTVRARPLPILPGQYFGRRHPEDGRIDWSRPASEIHNLIRAVAPPFPGAFSDCGSHRLWIDRARVDSEPARHSKPLLYTEQGLLFADCGDGRRIQVLKYRWSGPDATSALSMPLALGEHP